MAFYKTGVGSSGNRIDLHFDGRPDQSILDELKSTGWRWYAPDLCWYSYDSSMHRMQAERICNKINGCDEDCDYDEDYDYDEDHCDYDEDYDYDYDEDDEEDDWDTTYKRQCYLSVLKRYADLVSGNYYQRLQKMATASPHYKESYTLGRHFDIDSILKSVETRKCIVIEDENQNGILLCTIISEKQYYGGGADFENLADESVIKRFGYQVGKDSPLTTEERRKILSLLVDCNILTRGRIISHLEFLINTRSNSSYDYSTSISDWESDIHYLNNYKKNPNNPMIVKLLRTKW